MKYHPLKPFFFLPIISVIFSGCPQVTSTEIPAILTIEETIAAAGNSESERERYELLLNLQQHPDLETDLSQELSDLLPYIDRWANGRNKYHVAGDQELSGEGGYLGGFFVQDIWPGDFAFPSVIRGLSPLYPIWCLYRGRMLIWQAIEMGVLTEIYFSEGRDLLEEAATAFPDNRIITTYLGAKTPWPYTLNAPNHAPAWAIAQQKLLNHLENIMMFWIEERQTMDGQMGGGWGDDVEMWRKWTPVLLPFEHRASFEAQQKLARGIFSLPRLQDGYTNILTDVEHSSEDTGDPLMAMLLLDPESEEWQNKALVIAQLMQDLWTANNDLGFLQFKSTYFTANEVSNNDNFACDTAYHVRAIQPALRLWHQGNADAYDTLFERWLETWAHSVMQEGTDKPLGVLPSALHFPSGLAGGPNPVWWNPGCHITDKTFQYPRALAMMTDALIVAYLRTEDPLYLDPFRHMVNAWTQTRITPTDPESGNLQWAADKMRKYLPSALSKLRQATGNTEFDDFIAVEGSAWEKHLVAANVSNITATLEQNVESLAYNRAFFTEEVRFTDRIFKFHSNYLNDILATPIPNLNTTLLHNMLTGAVGIPNFLSLPGVRWHTSPQDIAIWVTQNQERELWQPYFILALKRERSQQNYIALMSLTPFSLWNAMECLFPYK